VYSVVVAELQAEVAGYACLGPTPLTESTWHLYWLCVHPSVQGQGVGQALQTHAEELVRARGGARLVVETSGRPDYERARRFYERAGYRLAGRIPNYYRLGDDCLFYCKPLSAADVGGCGAFAMAAADERPLPGG
jgi:ribosomal protein S18 acetylase RimI-like enzyme